MYAKCVSCLSTGNRNSFASQRWPCVCDHKCVKEIGYSSGVASVVSSGWGTKRDWADPRRLGKHLADRVGLTGELCGQYPVPRHESACGQSRCSDRLLAIFHERVMTRRPRRENWKSNCDPMVGSATSEALARLPRPVRSIAKLRKHLKGTNHRKGGNKYAGNGDGTKASSGG